MRTALRLALAAVAALALALSGCEAGFKDVAPPRPIGPKSAAWGATGKAAFSGPNGGFSAPDASGPEVEEPAEDPGP